MKNNNIKIILEKIEKFSNENPELRFTQILMMLGVNEFNNSTEIPFINDNYYESDNIILEKIELNTKVLGNEQ